jgi:hypothetical protein
MAHDVFISYATQDKTVADAVCATLESDGVRCWIAPRDILPGVAYAEALTDALRSSRVLVLVLSGSSNGSKHVMREVEAAVDVGIPVVPFKIADTTLSMSMKYLLKSIHWLDAMTPPLEQHVRKLAEVIHSLLKRSGPRIPAAARGTDPAICLPAGRLGEPRGTMAPGRRPSPRRNHWVGPLLLIALGAPLGVFGWWHFKNANPETPSAAAENERVSEKPVRPSVASAAAPAAKKDSTVAPKSTADPKTSSKSTATAASEPSASAPPQTRRTGPNPFVSIFNGKDLTGWEPLPGGTARWTVEDGAIVGRNGRGYLFTRRSDFADFDIRAEAKIAAGGNSGLFFRMPLTSQTKSGYEAQIDASNDPYPTGSLYGIAAPPKALSPPPADEWFTLQVIARGTHIRIFVNGRQTVNCVEADPRALKGHFALQQQVANKEIRFRKIEVKEFK